MFLELKLPVLDAKATPEANLKKFQSFIMKYLEEKIKDFHSKWFLTPRNVINLFTKYFNENQLYLNIVANNDHTYDPVFIKSVLPKYNENKEKYSINELYTVAYKGSIYPTYSYNWIQPILLMFIEGLNYTKSKAIEGKTNVFVEKRYGKIITTFPYINIMYYLLACEYFITLAEKLKLNANYQKHYKTIFKSLCLDILTSPTKDKLAWKAKQNLIFNPPFPQNISKNERWLRKMSKMEDFNTEKDKIVTPIALLKAIIGTNNLYKENAKGENTWKRKEYAKVYQHNNLWKSNLKNSDAVIKKIQPGLNTIQDEEIKNFLNDFKWVEIDKNTDLTKLKDFFNGFMIISDTIQRNILSPLWLDIKKHIFPKVFFKIRKLGQYKAHWVYFPWNKTLIVDINGWKSIIHEMWHMIHFILQEYYPKNKILNYMNSDKLFTNTWKQLLFMILFYKYAWNFLFKSNAKNVYATKEKLYYYLKNIEKIPTEKIDNIFSSLQNNGNANYILEDKYFNFIRKNISWQELILFTLDLINNNHLYLKSQNNYINFLKKLNIDSKEYLDIDFIKDFRKDYFFVYNKAPYTWKSNFKNYISSPIELFARLFDYYLRYILKNEKRLSNNLMNIIMNDLYVDEKWAIILDKKSKEIELLDMKIIKYISQYGWTQNYFTDIKLLLLNIIKL